MSKGRRDFLIASGRKGLLSIDEQKEIADELETYRDLSLCLERELHELIKHLEGE